MDDQHVAYNVFKFIQHPINSNDIDECFRIEVIDNIVKDMPKNSNYDDHLEYDSLNFSINPKQTLISY